MKTPEELHGFSTAARAKNLMAWEDELDLETCRAACSGNFFYHKSVPIAVSFGHGKEWIEKVLAYLKDKGFNAELVAAEGGRAPFLSVYW
jgi:hypothetical protein